MLNESQLVLNLENEWEMPDGFLGSLRLGIFREDRYEDFLALLNSIKNDGQINSRLVSLTWYIPLFMSWQKERVVELGGNPEVLERAINEVTSILENKLGIP